MANSGGGVILFGLDDVGDVSFAVSSQLPALDPAQLTDWIHKYTLVQFGEIEVHYCRKEERDVIAIIVGSSEVPLVFAKPGSYSIGNGKQLSVFSQGTVYFRHGAKSEPGTTEDLRDVIERARSAAINSLKEGLRRVVEAPPYSEILIVDKKDPPSIRVVDEDFAEPVRTLRPDKTHPLRQKDVLAEVKNRTTPTLRFNQHDVQCIKWRYHIEENPAYYYKSNITGSTAQYSLGFVDFIVHSINAEPDCLTKLRSEYKAYREQFKTD